MAVEERGLRNIPTTADALPAFLDEVVIALFERTGVLSPVELESRYEVYSEQYILSIGVEAKTTAETRQDDAVPRSDVVRLRSRRDDQRRGVARCRVRDDTAEDHRRRRELADRRGRRTRIRAGPSTTSTTTEDHMQYCAGTLRGLMDKVRAHADALESEVADEYWPLPKYREMLFIK